MLNRTLHEFISLYTEKPFDVISEVVRFMCGVINRSSYVCLCPNCSEKLIKFTIDEFNLIKEEENNLTKGE